uniref:sulfotransferase family protein n=1 Tax=Ruegeria arenilitoris TaxID=1173585 RepID=UPI00147A2E9B|nr:sulfotransferase [Ruegeria arenilitoris]
MSGNDESKLGSNYIFCGGCPRSGTTLLQRIIGNHSTVFSEQEFQYIPSHLVPFRRAISDGISQHNVDRIVDHSSLDEACRAFVNTVFKTKLEEVGKQVFCEKTPANALFIPEILEMFPKATFVLIIRDPRDVVNSFRGVRNRYLSKNLEPPKFVRSIARSVRELNRYLDSSIVAQRDDPRVLIVYYEDLVANPEKEVRKICAHTKLQFEMKMLDIKQSTAKIPAQKSELWYSREGLSAAISKSGVVTGKQLLSESEKSLVSLFTNRYPELERYALPNRPPSMIEKLQFKATKIDGSISSKFNKRT